MITALHAKRNRPYLHTLVFVLLVSWISLTISATCTMPMPSLLTTMIKHMPGCIESGTAEPHQDHTDKTVQDCVFKPCIDSQNDSSTPINRLVKPDLPGFILCLIWTSWYFFLSYPPTKVPHKADPPFGRRILLIYWFCTLLN